MSTRLDRWAPLTGVVFALLAAAGMASAQVPPGVRSSGETVLAFATKHAAGQRRADLLLIVGFAFLVLFAGSLRSRLQRSGAEAVASVALAGAAMMSAGAAMYFGFDYALASAPGSLTPAAAQSLNVLALQMVFPLAVGGFVFGVASGVAILRSGALPSWLGWAAIALGLLAPVWLVQVLLLYVWTVIVSILLWRRGEGSLPSPELAP
jgi:hypothetical protein